MTRNPNTTTFRFDEAFLKGLDAMAASHGVSRAEVVRQAVAAFAGSFEVAKNDQLGDLSTLRARYRDDDQLIVTIAGGAQGAPDARVSINGKTPNDVRAFLVLAESMDQVHVFLEVDHEDRAPLLARLGGETLLIPRAKMPIGELSWPRDPTSGIVIRIGDIDTILGAPKKDQRQKVKA